MTKKALGNYTEKMRQRHPRLSMRRMSLEIGLSPSVIEHIIKGKTGARPETLKKIADRWGTDDDYRELMRLAGHPLPKPAKMIMDNSGTMLYSTARNPIVQRLLAAVDDLPESVLDRVVRFALWERSEWENE